MTTYDAIVIGGSFAGLSAAIHLARARRSVCVIDAGQPRNRFADHSHGFFGRDGANPLEMIAEARGKVLAYPTVTFVKDTATSASRISSEHFEIELASGTTLSSARLVLAHGVTDRLPEIPGLTERWGKTVLHCPYCHGFEFSGRPLGILASSPHSVVFAQLISEWGPATLFLNGADEPDDAARAELSRRSVAIEPAPIAEVLGDGTEIAGIRLTDGRRIEISALFVSPATSIPPFAEQLGCALETGPTGPYIRTDPMKMTTIPGVFAAGDAANPMWNATLSTADGVMAGTAAHRSLVFGLPV
jgi:thioredoxin reductase